MTTARDEEAYKKWLYDRDLTLPEAFALYREDLFPKPLKEFACTIGRTGTEVFILCENVDDADEVLEWLSNLGVDSAG